jgi:hypothetical protein
MPFIIDLLYCKERFWELNYFYTEFGQYYKFPDNRRIGDLESIVEIKPLPTMQFASIIIHWYQLRLRGSVTVRDRHFLSNLVATRSRYQIVVGRPYFESQMCQMKFKNDLIFLYQLTAIAKTYGVLTAVFREKNNSGTNVAKPQKNKGKKSDICHPQTDPRFEKLSLCNLKRDKLDGRKLTRSANMTLGNKPRMCYSFNIPLDTDNWKITGKNKLCQTNQSGSRNVVFQFTGVEENMEAVRTVLLRAKGDSVLKKWHYTGLS